MNALLKKGIPFLLALLMIVGMFGACNGKKPNTPTGTQETEPPQGNDDADLYDSKGYLKDSLPETYDWNNDEFNIYTWDDQKNWEWAELQEGVEASNVTQKIVERQRAVEDRFGVTIKLTEQHGSWDNRTKFIQTLANNVQNNVQAFDLVGQYTPAAGIGAMQGLYLDLGDVPWLDLGKPWWPTSISETCTVGDQLYFVTGDITPTLIRNVHCMFLNTALYDSLDLGSYVENRSIYDVVRDGDWTLENFELLALDRMGNAEGNYGVTFLNNVAADAFFYGGGFSLVNNMGGVLTMSDDLKGQPLSNYFDEIKKLFIGSYQDAGIHGIQPFVEKKAIFYAGNIADSQKLTEEKINFTILPQPKLNKAQEKYATVSNFWVTMYSVPTDAKNTQKSGMILEALASQAYRTLTDEIYFNLFQARYNADDGGDSAEMFDTVSDSVVFDTARFFADELGMFAKFRMGVSDSSDPKGSWSTIYGGESDIWAGKIENIYGKVG